MELQTYYKFIKHKFKNINYGPKGLTMIGLSYKCFEFYQRFTIIKCALRDLKFKYLKLSRGAIHIIVMLY